jgi:hypothetical protein
VLPEDVGLLEARGELVLAVLDVGGRGVEGDLFPAHEVADEVEATTAGDNRARCVRSASMAASR